jgi:NAD(P)-dependent dehydrogenase (short-subunit alcohol dehydrogenase family)
MKGTKGHKATKTAIVTGATRGLGRIVAQILSDAGYRVADCSRTSPHPVDVRQPKQVSKFIANFVAKHGRIDVVVNNAGYVQPLAPLSRTSERVLQNAFQTNTFGPFFVMKTVIPIMRRQSQGMIVNIASKAAIYTVPNLGVYSASKAALVSLTEAAAKELSNTNVLCVTVCPSGMRTGMRAAVYGSENANAQQSPQRVATFVGEIINSRTVNGIPINHGACVIVRKDKVEIREMQDG